MQNKERLIEIQTIFAKWHIPLLACVLMFTMVSAIINLFDSISLYISCSAICVSLGTDIYFGYRYYFHSTKVLMLVRVLQLLLIGVFFGNADYTIAGKIIDLMVIIFYVQFVIEFAYIFDFTERSTTFIISLIIQIPFVISILKLMLFNNDIYRSLLVIMITIIVSFVCFLCIFNYIGEMQKYTDECIFAKDRLLDTAKDNFDKIDENQKKLVIANEQLGIKKFELEEANKNVSRANMEANLLNTLLQKLSLSLDAKVVLDEMSRIFEANFDIFYSGALFRNNTSRSELNSTLYRVFNEDEVKGMIKAFLNGSFLKKHYQVGSNYVDYDVDYEKFPFFERNNIRSVIVKTLYKESAENASVYLLLSNEYNAFKGKEQFFDTVMGQITVAANNIYLYNKVENLAKIDALSGLYNRRFLNVYFDDKFIKHLKANGKVVSAVMMDIDKFKTINDTYGHLFGDQAIMMVSHTIDRVARENNGSCFRFGGEEFVILFEDKNTVDVYKITEEIRKIVKETPITYNNDTIHVRISAGISSYPQIVTDISLLIDRADKAMYYSKQNGRDMTTIDDGEN